MKYLFVLLGSMAIGGLASRIEPLETAQACDCDTAADSFQLVVDEVEGPESALEFWEQEDIHGGAAREALYVFHEGENASLDLTEQSE